MTPAKWISNGPLQLFTLTDQWNEFKLNILGQRYLQRAADPLAVLNRWERAEKANWDDYMPLCVIGATNNDRWAVNILNNFFVGISWVDTSQSRRLSLLWCNEMPCKTRNIIIWETHDTHVQRKPSKQQKPYLLEHKWDVYGHIIHIICWFFFIRFVSCARFFLPLLFVDATNVGCVGYL